MRDLDILLSLIATIIGLLVTVITFIVKTAKVVKAKRIAEQTIKISDFIQTQICDIEKCTFLYGVEKKAYVIDMARKFAIANKIQFDQKQVEEKIEEFIALTKQVNCKFTNLIKGEK